VIHEGGHVCRRLPVVRRRSTGSTATAIRRLRSISAIYARRRSTAGGGSVVCASTGLNGRFAPLDIVKP